MMNLKKWHLEKYQELRYLSQQIARNEAEASGQQSRDQQCINWTTSIQRELNFYCALNVKKICTNLKEQTNIWHTDVLS